MRDCPKPRPRTRTGACNRHLWQLAANGDFVDDTRQCQSGKISEKVISPLSANMLMNAGRGCMGGPPRRAILPEGQSEDAIDRKARTRMAKVLLYLAIVASVAIVGTYGYSFVLKVTPQQQVHEWTVELD